VTTTRRDREVGLALGFLGVLGFSFSLPATKVAVADLDPWFVAFGRAAVAAVPRAGAHPSPARPHDRGSGRARAVRGSRAWP
jgi:hypothetical protein